MLATINSKLLYFQLEKRYIKYEMRIARNLFYLIAMLLAVSCSESISDAQRGERQQAAGDCKAAIGSYERHMQKLLEQQAKKKSGSKESPNPYFYQILIADCQREMGELLTAEQSYVRAFENGVDRLLVAERLRRLADAYDKRKEFEAAIALLQRHRSLDLLLFDAAIDRRYKELFRMEDEQKAKDQDQQIQPRLPQQ